MNRRFILLALTFAILGIALTAHQYPKLRAVQILLPFAFGVLVGTLLGRGLPSPRHPSPVSVATPG
jgi:hypothetical protein